MSLNLRKVALKLHGLETSDREWLFQQLPEEYHSDLRTMLQEMEEIGIPKDGQEDRQSNTDFGNNLYVDEKKDLSGLEEVQSEELPTNSHVPDYVNQIEQAPKLIVFELLDNEPNGVVATILAFYSWYWLREYLNRCKAKQRKILARLAKEIKAKSTPKLIEHTVVIFSHLIQERMNAEKKEEDLPLELIALVDK